jgi:hypothetical protein
MVLNKIFSKHNFMHHDTINANVGVPRLYGEQTKESLIDELLTQKIENYE